MLRLSLVGAAVASVVSCAQPGSPGVVDGRSLETAIPIGASRTPQAIQLAQRDWFSRNLPDAVPDFGRARYWLSTRVIQAVPAVMADQSEVVIFFDVTPQ